MDRHINPPSYRCPEPQGEGHRHTTSIEVQIGGDKNDHIRAVTAKPVSEPQWGMGDEAVLSSLVFGVGLLFKLRRLAELKL